VTRLRLEAGNTFRSLRSHNVRRYFLGQLISQTGTWFEAIAVTWLMLELTGSGVALGLVTAARFGPLLVLGPWGGVLSDRLDRQRLMLISQFCFAALAVVESVLVVTGNINAGLFYLFAAGFGVLTAIDSPARRAFVTELVPVDDVPNAVGLNSALMTGARTVGPALAGLLIAGPGIEWCFVINAVSFLPVIGALLSLDRSQFRSSPRVAKAKGQLREGFRYVLATPNLMLPLAMATVIGTLAFNYQVTLPLLAERDLAGDAGTFTLLYASMSLGSVVGALAVARRTRVDMPFLVAGGAGMAATTMALTLAPTTPLALLAALPVGFTSFLVISGSNAMAQVDADPAMKGRVLALFSTVFLGSTPIGGPIVGWISQEIGPRVGLAVGGIATALVTLWVVRRLRRSGRTDRTGRTVGADPAPATTEPEPAAA
jgi:MFS family permease